MTNVLGVPVHDADEHWMRHALALAERAQREEVAVPTAVVEHRQHPPGVRRPPLRREGRQRGP